MQSFGRKVDRRSGSGFSCHFGTAVLLLGVIWLVGGDGGLPAFATTVAEHARTTSFIWPAAGTLFGLVVAVALVLRPEWRTPGAAVLLCGETILLLVAGSILLSSSPNGYPPTRAVRTLQGIVGSSRVAADTYEAVAACGLKPLTDLLYGASELDAYDPILP